MFEFWKLPLHLSVPHQHGRSVLIHREPYPEATGSIIRVQRYDCDALEYRGWERQEQLGGCPCRPVNPCTYHALISFLHRIESYVSYSPATLGDDNDISTSTVEHK